MEPIDQLEQQLKDLKLKGVSETLQERLRLATSEDIGFQGFLNLILQDEIEFRRNSRIKSLLKGAKFSKQATLEAFDYQFPRKVSKKIISELATLNFLREGLNLIFTGPTGVGKSHLACAIGNHACRKGYSTLFININMLVERFELERAKGTYLNFLQRMKRVNLLILDDFGIKPMTPSQYQDFYDLVEERSEDNSTIITTKVSIQNWSEIIDDPVVCEAVTDRLASRSLPLEFKGDTYRSKKTEKIKNHLTDLKA
jgi:DNA replication protein DnaC